MTHRPDNLEEAFARLRCAAEADREACAHLPAAIEAMMFALLVRLLSQLQGMARAWAAANRHPVSRRPASRQAGLSRSHARIASGLVPPRAERSGPFCHWLVSLHRNRGMRPAAPAPARPAPCTRAPPRRSPPPPDPPRRPHRPHATTHPHIFSPAPRRAAGVRLYYSDIGIYTPLPFSRLHAARHLAIKA